MSIPRNLRHRSRFVASISFGVVLALAAVFALRGASGPGNMGQGHRVGGARGFSEPVGVLTQTPLDATAGFKYSLPTTLPKITREQAIASAQNEGLVPGDAKPASVNYVLMSYTSPEGQKRQAWVLKEAGIQTKYPDGFKNIPVWIVTFRGLNMLPNLGPSSDGTPGTTPTVNLPSEGNHELNVVISADTGKYMEAFTYR